MTKMATRVSLQEEKDQGEEKITAIPNSFLVPGASVFRLHGSPYPSRLPMCWAGCGAIRREKTLAVTKSTSFLKAQAESVTAKGFGGKGIDYETRSRSATFFWMVGPAQRGAELQACVDVFLQNLNSFEEAKDVKIVRALGWLPKAVRKIISREAEDFKMSGFSVSPIQHVLNAIAYS
ncbi:hypothetical protein DFH29DRAFT_875977 [Suillus ampliporus]|nr:hypothetical protein DFH29DRAFT_875977 [Suillus ampliporus]